jgi:hypothetical protein
MDAKSILLTGVTMALAPAVQNAAIEEREPVCGIEAELPDAEPLACPVKQPLQHHDERHAAVPMYQPVLGVTVTRPLSDAGPQPLGGIPSLA